MVDQLRFFAGAARVLEGKAAGEYMKGHTSWVRREPIGVVGQVTPWNYPMMMAIWKIAPALAAGNTVVLKPSDTTPETTLLLAELASEFLPDGHLQRRHRRPRDRPHARRAPRRPALVAITGSVRAGMQVAESAVARRQARAPRARRQGAGRRLRRRRHRGRRRGHRRRRLLQRRPGLHRGHPRARRPRASTTTSSPRSPSTPRSSAKVGMPDDEDALFGPVNNAEPARATSSGFIDRLPDHARVAAGGHRADGLGDGYFFEPTVLSGLRQDDEAIQNEIFGPVITVQQFTDEAEALAWANGVEYGLASSRVDQGLRPGDADVASARLRLRLDQHAHPARRRDAARGLQAQRLRQGPVDVRLRGLHPHQARHGQHRVLSSPSAPDGATPWHTAPRTSTAGSASIPHHLAHEPLENEPHERELLRHGQPASCAPPCCAASSAAPVRDDGRRRRRRGRLPRRLRLRRQEPDDRRGGTGSAARPRPRPPRRTCPTPRRSSTGRTGPQYIDVDDEDASRARRSRPSRSRPASRSTTPRTTTTTTSSTPRSRPLLEGGKDTGRDVWCSTDWMVARLIRQGYVQKLDLANIPNADEPRCRRSRTSSSTRAGVYSLPWQSGFAGIAYNLKATGGKKIETIDPAAHRPGPQGQGHAAHRDARHRRPRDDGAGQGHLERSPTPTSRPRSTCSSRPRTPARSKGFTGNEYTEGLAKGDIAACIAWTGDVVAAAVRRRQRSSTPCPRRASRSGPTTSSSRRWPSTRRTPRS